MSLRHLWPCIAAVAASLGLAAGAADAAGEIPGSKLTKATIATGETFTSALDRFGDVDWIRFEAAEGQNFLFRGRFDGVSGCIRLRIVNKRGKSQTGNACSRDGWVPPPSHVAFEWTAFTAGTYFIDVEELNPKTAEFPKPYTIEAVEDSGSSFLTDCRATVDTRPFDSFQFYGEDDARLVRLRAGHTYYARQSVGSLYVYSPERDLIAAYHYFDHPAYITFTAPTTGDYLIDSWGCCDIATPLTDEVRYQYAVTSTPPPDITRANPVEQARRGAVHRDAVAAHDAKLRREALASR